MPRVEKVARPWMKTTVPTGTQQGRKNDNRKLYASAAWRKCSEMHRRQNPLCVECLKRKKTTDCSPGTRRGVTDHIIPINQGGETWKPANWQTLCNKCHNAKSGKDK